MQNHQYIAQQTGINLTQVEATTKLLEQDCTIPFIARYRKDNTGNLDEVQILDIKNAFLAFEKLEKRKIAILEKLKELKITEASFLSSIQNCYDIKDLERLFEPYKASKNKILDLAKQEGYEKFAKMLMSRNSIDVFEFAQKNRSSNFKTREEVIKGFEAVIVDFIYQQSYTFVFENAQKHGLWKTKKKKDISAELESKFRTYLEFEKPLKYISSHQFLGIERAFDESAISKKLVIDDDYLLDRLNGRYLKTGLEQSEFIESTIKQAFKKKIFPKVDRELWKIGKEKADEEAIKIFGKNLTQLLLSPPLGEKRVLGIDPGFRTGCKMVCIDKNGNLLYNETIYPHHNEAQKKTQAAKKIRHALEVYKIEAIAIGDGTAGKETMDFVKQQTQFQKVPTYLVDESGASVYSASKIAREEFPEYDITVRGSVSIARRLIDPLSELIKIDPQSIGVGQYQHSVDQKKLAESLQLNLEFCVNKVGVNLNTASVYLLKSVSGLNETLAKRIVEKRSELGGFTNRKELKKIKGLGDKTYQQAVAFLKIKDGDEALDNTFIHPENYKDVYEMANVSTKTKDWKIVKEKIAQLNYEDINIKNLGEYTFKDIKENILKPNLDPRESLGTTVLENKLKGIEDLFVGQKLKGRVKNITNFGCFVDLGIKQNGLLHVSKMAKRFVSDVHEIVSINQVLEVEVIKIELEDKRIALSIIEEENNNDNR
ncbi:MAG: helix-hairpin-helix domain-containing protein [Flavobacteriales bacterium]